MPCLKRKYEFIYILIIDVLVSSCETRNNIVPIRGNNLAARHAIKEICQICTKNGLSLFIQPSQAVYQNLRQHNLIGDAMKWGLGEVDSSCESEPNDLSRFACRISNSRFNTTA